MFTFSKASSQPRPRLRFWTFNGWSGTMERVRALGAPPAKLRKSILWLRRGNSNQSVERPNKAPFKQSISPPLPLNCSPFPLMVASKSPRTTEIVEASVPVYGVGTNDHPAFGPFCTKVVLVASHDPLRPCRIRRIHTRKELPWIPISKPLPPLPLLPDSGSQPATDASQYLSATPSSSIYSYHTTPRNSLEDDGLDDLSLFLRRIAYDAITASTIHRHLGFMEDGGRVLPLGLGRRSISPPRRYSSLVGVSLAIMEGRLPKALMVM